MLSSVSLVLAALGAVPWCPAPPKGFDVTPLACVADPADRRCANPTHCDCANEQLSHGTCAPDATLEACVGVAAAACAADSACRSFAMQSQNCSTATRGGGFMWESYPFASDGVAPNGDWVAYARAGAPSPGPSPGPAPGPSPTPPAPTPSPTPPSPWPPIPAHGRIVPDIVGRWDGPTPALPDSKVPQVPMLGNGYMGVLLEGSAANVTAFLSTNGFWTVESANPDPNAHDVPHAHRAATGGLTFAPKPSHGQRLAGFAAEQRIGPAELTTTHSEGADGGGATLTTTVTMHPADNVLVAELAWAGPDAGLRGLEVEVSAWVPAAHWWGDSPYNPKGDWEEVPGSAAFACDGAGRRQPSTADADAPTPSRWLCVARNSSGSTVPTPRQTWAGVALQVSGGQVTRTSVTANTSAIMYSERLGPLALARAVSTVVIPANGSVVVVAALSESVFSTMNASVTDPVSISAAGDETRDPVPAAAALAARTTPSA
eukprot:g4162.t1